MKRTLLSLLCTAALLLSLAGCAGGQSSPTSDTNTNMSANAAASTDDYDAASAVSLVFSDGSITGGGDGAEADGTALTISAAGTYLVSGSCSDGSITVKKGVTGVTLVLSGLTLTSSDTAPITCSKSSEVTILAADGTTNTLTDSAQNNDDNYPDNEAAENAVIKCKDGSTVTLCGSGTLNITANGKNGVKSGATTDEEGDASLTIRGLTLNITAPVNDAINAEQALNIESGTLTISAGDDAIHCDYVMNVGASGTAGPDITVTECCEGLEAATLNILSGSISILSEDDCLNAANSDLTGYSFSITISGGTINAYSSSGDGFDSNGDLTITGGAVVVWTASTADNQPLDADGTLSVTGGTVLAAGGSAGMGVQLSAAQPCVTFGSTGAMGGFGGRMPSGQAPDGTAEPPERPDGQSGDRPEPPSGQTSGSAAPSGGGSGVTITAGETVTLRDADGNILYSGEAPCDARYLFFSSPDLTDGAEYTLLSGGTALAESSASTEAQSGGFGGGQRPGGNGAL